MEAGLQAEIFIFRLFLLLGIFCVGQDGATLRWRHTGRDSVSNHQPHDYLLKRLFRRRSKKNQSSASLAFVRVIHLGPVNSPHKWPLTRKMFPFDDVIIKVMPHARDWGLGSSPRDFIFYKYKLWEGQFLRPREKRLKEVSYRNWEKRGFAWKGLKGLPETVK